jgi:hypothetical protein
MILFNGDQTPGQEDLLSDVQPVPTFRKTLVPPSSVQMFYDRPKHKISVTEFGKTQFKFVISSFRRQSDETCALLGHQAAYGGNSLPTSRDSLSEPSSRVKTAGNTRYVVRVWCYRLCSSSASWQFKMGRTGSSETSARDRHYTLPNVPEDGRSQTSSVCRLKTVCFIQIHSNSSFASADIS